MANHRVLIVDDEPAIRRLLIDAFQRAGYETLEASDGGQAVKAASKSPVDVLVTDLVMAEKEGLELIRHFRKHWSEVIVIAMSGDAARHLKSARLLGAQETFEKPLNTADMVETVGRLIAQRQSSTE
jgi:DNA-binding NtrC family response regulator